MAKRMIPEFPSEQQRDAIDELFDALAADYGARFTNQFDHDRISANKWKWRLFCQIKSVNPRRQAIVEGAARAIAECKEAPPTIPLIAAAIRERQKELARSERELAKANDLARLPKPVLERAERLVETRKNVRQWCDTGLLIEGAEKPLEDLIAEHEALISKVNVRRPPPPPCCVPGCTRPGTMSGSTTGTENWYCREHYQM